MNQGMHRVTVLNKTNALPQSQTTAINILKNILKNSLLSFADIQGLPLTAKLLTHEELLSVSGQLECEAPNRHLYEFAGNIRLTGRQSVDSCLLTYLPLTPSCLVSSSDL